MKISVFPWASVGFFLNHNINNLGVLSVTCLFRMFLQERKYLFCFLLYIFLIQIFFAIATVTVSFNMYYIYYM